MSQTVLQNKHDETKRNLEKQLINAKNLLK